MATGAVNEAVKARRGTAWQVRACHGEVWQSWRGEVWQGLARSGTAGLGLVSAAGLGEACQGPAGYGSARLGEARTP